MLLPPDITYSVCIAVLGELTVCLCSQDGWTALHMAAQEGRVDVVRLLTEAQAQVNIQTEVYIVVRSHLLRQNAINMMRYQQNYYS